MPRLLDLHRISRFPVLRCVSGDVKLLVEYNRDHRF